MNFNELDATMRQMEAFHSLRIPEGEWTIIRLDGRSFSKLTEFFEKPFSDIFYTYMDKVCGALMDEFHPSLIYHQSDEISMLFPSDFDMFNRSVEKMVSVTASFTSSRFSVLSGIPCSFDSRIWISVYDINVLDYFSWRRQDAVRNSVNCAAYWALRQQGQMSKRQATRVLELPGVDKKLVIRENTGKTWDEIEEQFRYGTAYYRSKIPHTGFNPLTQESVTTTRNITISQPPVDSRKYLNLVAELMNEPVKVQSA